MTTSYGDDRRPEPPTWSDTQRWLADLDGEPPPAQPSATAHDTHHPDGDGTADIDPDPTDPATDEDATTDVAEPGESHAPRFNKTVAAAFAAVTAIATLTVTAALLAMRTDPHVADEPASPTTQISVIPPPPPPSAADAAQDTPIPFTASAACPPGSTAAQTVAGDDPTRAWVCVRGGVDGQVLTLELGRTMVVTAVSLTPGWIGADTGGQDQWTQHRVVTRVQWILNDDAATVVAQHTGNVRGEAVQPMPERGVLASKVTMIVLETSRARADSAPSPTPAASPPGDGPLGDILAPPSIPAADLPLPGLPGRQTPDDPADNTFAVSSIKILGHPPQ